MTVTATVFAFENNGRHIADYFLESESVEIYDTLDVNELHELSQAVRMMQPKGSKEVIDDEDEIYDFSYCPICSANPLPPEDQPQSGLHAFTTIFECGCKISAAISGASNGEYIIDESCE